MGPFFNASLIEDQDGETLILLELPTEEVLLSYPEALDLLLQLEDVTEQWVSVNQLVG